MFAKSFLRPARTIQSQLRRYATDNQPKSSNNAAIFGGLAAVGGVAGYYWLQSGAPTPKPENIKRMVGNESGAEGSPASKNEEGNVPQKHDYPSGHDKPVFTGGEQGFVSLRLDEIIEVNHNTKKFRFHLGDDEAKSGLPIMSAILMKFKGPHKEDKPVVRPYTPISDEDAPGWIEFIVKRYPNGPMSEHLHNMREGQRLDFKGPLPKYPWEENKHKQVVLVAGGTGITPMYQLARKIFSNPADRTQVTLIFANISEQDILLKKEWQDLENTYPQRMRAFYVLEQPPDDWEGGKTGRVDKQMLKTLLPEPKVGQDVKIFVCGPPGFYKAISGTKKSPQDQGELEGYLQELGYSKDQVYKL